MQIINSDNHLYYYNHINESYENYDTPITRVIAPPPSTARITMNQKARSLPARAKGESSTAER